MSSERRRLAGIANLGNTCYMNSAIQCGIVACDELYHYFASGDYLEIMRNPSNTTSIAKSLAWLLGEIQNEENRNAIYPSMVKSSIDELMPRFRGTNQNDCSEFLLELLDKIHEELNINRDTNSQSLSRSTSSSFSMLTRSASSVAAMNGSISGKSIRSINWRSKGEQWWIAHRKKENSIIKILFEGAIRSVMTCDSCGGISARFETFSQLILPLSDSRRSKYSLVDLLGELFQNESIDGIDCDYCKRKRIFSRTADIWRLPPYLILTLGRFSFDYTARKINIPVEYPVDSPLSLEHLVANDAPLQRTAEYELYGVIEHEGTLNRGHYTACVRLGDQWHYVNDSRVTKIDKSAVIGRNAYMLFYKWREIDAMDDLEHS